MDHAITMVQPFGAQVQALKPGACIEEIDLAVLRALFQTHQLIVLREFQAFATTEAFTRYCERWGDISLWPFGKVLELIQHEKPSDHIFDNSYVPLHWDGMYRPHIPEYQIFRCVSAPLACQGGRTTFSNTILALQHAPTETKKLWQGATGIYKRHMDFYRSKTVSPIINRHPYQGYEVLRYNEPPSDAHGRFVNPPDLQFTGIKDEESDLLHRSLKESLYHPAHFYAHEWQTGDIVIADNFSLLHGREKFTCGSPRHLQRVHVSSNPAFPNPGLRDYE